MLDPTEYAKIFVSLLAILDPLGAVPIFFSFTGHLDVPTRHRITRVIAVTVAIVLLASLFFGEVILSVFGISINSFRVGGGILLMLIAVSMLQAKHRSTLLTEEQTGQPSDGESIAVVPLAVPLLAGPGAISTVILDAHKGSSPVHYGIIAGEILALALLLWIVLRLSPLITRYITATGINIFTRLMGLLLMAIGVEFIASGLKGLFPLLAR